MERVAAADRLKSMVDADSDPSLSAAELDALLSAARVPDSAGNRWTNDANAGGWQASTAVVPTTVIAVGDRYWRCTVGGTTDSTEPSWPDLSATPAGDRMVTDGGVVWTDNGTTWSPTFDLNRAAMAGWDLKAGKAAGRYDFSTDDQRFARAQIAAHCREQAERYRRLLTSGT